MGRDRLPPDWQACEERELERLGCGDDEDLARAALVELRRRHDDDLRTRASHRCGRDGGLTEEAMQRLDARLWEKRRSYKPDKGRWLAWARVILVNIIIDLFRERLRFEGGAPPAPTDTDADSADPMDRFPGALPPVDHGFKLQELQGAMQDCLGRLPLEQREALTLQVLEGLSLEEIGERTGVSQGTTGVRVYRARERMRACLRSKGYEGGGL